MKLRIRIARYLSWHYSRGYEDIAQTRKSFVFWVRVLGHGFLVTNTTYIPFSKRGISRARVGKVRFEYLRPWKPA